MLFRSVLAVIDTPATADPGMTVGVPLAALKGLEADLETESATAPIAINLPAQPTRDMLQRTIIPDAVEARMLTLHERGALLQRVHFANFMDGYDVYIGSGGRIATQMQGPMATLQVRGMRVSVLVNDPGVRIDGRPIAVGTAVPLTSIAEIEVDGHSLHYRDLTGVRLEGWPYVGELRQIGRAHV